MRTVLFHEKAPNVKTAEKTMKLPDILQKPDCPKTEPEVQDLAEKNENKFENIVSVETRFPGSSDIMAHEHSAHVTVLRQRPEICNAKRVCHPVFWGWLGPEGTRNKKLWLTPPPK